MSKNSLIIILDLLLVKMYYVYMISIREKEFFKQLSINSRIASLETVRDVYFGLVKTFAQQMKERHVVTLPDWGRFNLNIRKGRIQRNINDGSMIMIPDLPTVKFISNKRLKKYFQSLGKDGTVIK